MCAYKENREEGKMKDEAYYDKKIEDLKKLIIQRKKLIIEEMWKLSLQIPRMMKCKGQFVEPC